MNNAETVALYVDNVAITNVQGTNIQIPIYIPLKKGHTFKYAASTYQHSSLALKAYGTV